MKHHGHTPLIEDLEDGDCHDLAAHDAAEHLQDMTDSNAFAFTLDRPEDGPATRFGSIDRSMTHAGDRDDRSAASKHVFADELLDDSVLGEIGVDLFMTADAQPTRKCVARAVPVTVNVRIDDAPPAPHPQNLWAYFGPCGPIYRGGDRCAANSRPAAHAR